MPVDFLTVEQEQRYGRFAGDPTAAQLARAFHLDDADQQLLADRRGDHNRLGFALQRCTVSFLATFLPDPTDVPVGVVTTLAAQLRIGDVSCLERYRGTQASALHAREIRRHYGYHDFTDQPGHFRLVRWLYSRAWLSAERPTTLFDVSVAWLLAHHILLPGITTLTRLIASVRERAAARLYQVLARVPTTEQRAQLEQLLVVPDRARVTPLDRLRRAPTRISAGGMLGALQRLAEVRALNMPTASLPQVPAGRVQHLARYAAAARAQALSRMPAERRIATLVAFATTLEATAQDDALDLLEQLTELLLARATRVGQKERLRTLKDLDAAALRLQEACTLLLDTSFADADVRAAVFDRVPPAQLASAVARVRELARPPDDQYFDELLTRYNVVRRFLPTLLDTVVFAGTAAGRPVLDALQFLRQLDQPQPPPPRQQP